MDPGELRLRHLLSADEQPAVRDHEVRRVDSGRVQHRRPRHGVEPQDVLADEVHTGPERLEELAVRVVERGDVVEQRLDPNVDDVLRIPRDRDPPAERRSRDRRVLQVLREADHFVQSRLRVDRCGRARVVLVDEPVLVLRQPEEVVLFRNDLDRDAVDRTFPVDQLFGLVELLTRNAVEAFVFREVHITRVVQALPELLHPRLVALFGRPDEVVIRDV